jgi:hypothetical protein
MKCPDCDFEAKNNQSLQMHRVRKHTSKGATWGKGPRKPKPKTSSKELVVVNHRKPKVESPSLVQLTEYTVWQDQFGAVYLVEKIHDGSR